jgi:hypothetical protein
MISLAGERGRFGWLLLVLLAVVALSLPGLAPAQAFSRAIVQQRARDVDQLFNWYYAAIYGTGVYKIGEQTVGVLRAPFSYRLREAGEDQWGARLTVPVTAALAEFDLGDFNLGNVHTAGLSVLPGVEVEIPLAPQWTLKPFVNAGAGWEFERSSSALIYSTGATVVRRAPLDNGWLSTLGGRLTFAGYKAGDEGSRLLALDGGGGVDIPVDMTIGGRPAFFGVQFIGTVYFNKLEFLLPGSAEKQVLAEAEIAFTLGVRKPVEFMGASFDRVGLGFRKGSDGLKGIRLVGSFPF